MTTLPIACGAALTATALVAAVFVFVHPSKSEERLARVIDRFNAHTEWLVVDLARAIERAEADRLDPAIDLSTRAN